MLERWETDLRVFVALPVYNEEQLVADCLDALDIVTLPEGCDWGTWFIINDLSVDESVEVVLRWSDQHPRRHVVVLNQSRRSGKTAALELARHTFMESSERLDALLCVDADICVKGDSIYKLMSPYQEDVEIVGTVGSSLPIPGDRGGLASKFQMLLIHELDRTGPADVMRSHGRLYSIRPHLMPGFSWHEVLIADDLQVSYYVARSGLSARSVPDAISFAIPCKNFRDFHGQTSRGRRALVAARELWGDVGVANYARMNFHAMIRRALGSAKVAIMHPAGAICFVTFWLSSLVVSRFLHADSLTVWRPANSSKRRTT